MRIRTKTSLCLWLLAGIAAAKTEPYIPDIVEPATQSWMWRELEPLQDKGFRNMGKGPNNTIFFGTEQGVYQYNGYALKQLERDGIDASPIISFHTSRSGAAYAASRQTLYVFENGRWREIYAARARNFSFGGFAEDANGVIWVRSDAGVLRIEDKQITLAATFDNWVIGVAIDRNQKLWVSLYHKNEVYECDTSNVVIEPAQHCTTHEPEVIKTSNNLIQYPFADSKGNLWLINRKPDVGILRYSSEQRNWFYHDIRLIHTSALETYDGTIFFGSTTALYAYRNGKMHLAKYSEPAIYNTGVDLLETQKNRLLLGVAYSKVYQIDRSENQFTIYRKILYQDETKDGVRWFLDIDGQVVSHDTNSGKWLLHTDADNLIDTPVALLAEKNGKIIVAGADRTDTAISIYDEIGWKKHVFKDFSPTINFRALFQANDGSIYLGSGPFTSEQKRYSGGILKINLSNESHRIQVERIVRPDAPYMIVDFAQTKKSNVLFQGRDKVYTLENNRATPLIFPDSMQNPAAAALFTSNGVDTFWLASFSQGLHSFNGVEWKTYPIRNAIGYKSITNILAVPNASLYIATLNGISHFDGANWNPQYLPPELVMPRNGGVMKQDTTGALWLGHTSFYWYRRAREVDEKRHEYPKVRSIRYTPDRDPPSVIIRTHVAQMQPNSSQTITWEGSDKWNQTQRKLLRYSYRLNENQWSAFNQETSVTLSDLVDGEYAFQLRVKDAVGNVNARVEQINFTMLPPIWKQAWFLAVIGSLLATIISLVVFIVRLREKHLLALDKVKLEFYTNITHELRTPLTIILGPLERLRKEVLDPEHARLAQLAHKSSQRLKQLVDQVLNIRKIETGHETLQLEEGDPIVFAKEASMHYIALADEKKILLKREFSATTVTTSFDKDKLQKILDNLINNAIKYTPEGGTVTIRAAIDETEHAGRSIRFEIEDTGVGITPKAQKHIFDSYYRAVPKQSEPGFGIGLAYVEKLVEICNGNIVLQSPINVDTRSGTRFVVSIPTAVTSAHSTIEATNIDDVADNDSVSTFNQIPYELPILLIIEDNQDIREYLKLELSSIYSIIEAHHGKDGLDIARKTVPDIILSDVMMPEMNGLECCHMLKTDLITSHIPVILLTAYHSREHELAGLQTRADDYITKPVDIEILKARLRNQLDNRRKIHDHFRSEPASDLRSLVANNTDKRFLQCITDYIEKEIANPELDINELSSQLGFSRTTLYRKIKAVSGLSPTRLVRSLRLRTAASLLEAGDHSISDAMTLAGFQDLSYFSKVFKAQYHQTPSDYLAKKKRTLTS